MSEFSGIKMFLKKGLDGTGNVNVFYTFRCRCGTPRMCPALGSPAVLFPTPNMNLFSRSPTVSEFCPFLLKSTLTIFMPILKIRVTVFSIFWVFFVVNCKRRWRSRSRCSENCFVEAKAIYGQFGTILTAAKKFSVFCSFLVFFCPDYNLLIICEERVLFWIWISQKDEKKKTIFF